MGLKLDLPYYGKNSPRVVEKGMMNIFRLTRDKVTELWRNRIMKNFTIFTPLRRQLNYALSKQGEYDEHDM